MKIHETGNWAVGSTDKGKTVFIESDDFTHDVRLYVNGDFTDHNERIAYAEEIAQRLNIAVEHIKLGPAQIKILRESLAETEKLFGGEEKQKQVTNEVLQRGYNF